jgi:uridine phosphorylase
MPWFDTLDSVDVTSPAQSIAYKRSLGLVPDRAPPEGVILCYQTSLLEYVLEHHVASSGYGFLHSMHWLKAPYEHLAIQRVKTAPEGIIKLEQFIALGVKKFISIGTAGSIDPKIAIGDLVVCDRAIRDDGVSQHYLPEEKYAHASPGLTEKIAGCLEQEQLAYHRGTSWTTSALFRETRAAIMQCQKEGVATVEMEAAALFSVARFRSVDLASLLTISDNLSTLTWHPEFHADTVTGGLEKIFHVAVNALK